MATVPKLSQAQRDNSFDCFPILKIAGGVKELTVHPNCSMPENDEQCVIPVKCCISFKTISIVGLNSTFLVVPQSEFTLKGSILGFNVVQPETRFHFKSAN
jgi:hypothetical protein